MFLKKSKKIWLIILCVFLSLVIIFTSAFFIMKYIGKKQFHEKDKNIENKAVVVEDNDTLTYNGKKYTLNKNIVSVLVMGIDKNSLEETKINGSNGQADCIFVAAIDTQTKKIKIIPISRETMVDVNLYTKKGDFTGMQNEQLCLAYAYCDDAKLGCKNVQNSVSRLLYGINISSYVAIDFNGLKKLTGLVGGLDVNSLETISDGDISFKEGETTTLKGDKALAYIRLRGDDLEANNRRMARQKQFLTELVNKAGNKVLNDFSLISSYYNAMSKDTITDVSLSQLTYLATECVSSNMGNAMEYYKIDGTMKAGDFREFYADDTSTLETVISVFYNEKK